jgi:2-C-methyl-D-erythritol 4-phosphate cytidylyltransferase
MVEVCALVPAGGIGTRLGHRVPKQFLRVSGVSILVATVRRLRRLPALSAVVVAAPEAYIVRTRRLLGAGGRRAPITVVPGGPTRQESVWRALQAAPATADIVVVHDAVRPFITRALLQAGVTAAAEAGAAICALPVTETVKRVRDGFVEDTVDRDGLWSVQTPQAFRAALLREAHDKARRDGIVGTDDSMLVERLGHRVRVVPGVAGNVKITTPHDLRRARSRG